MRYRTLALCLIAALALTSLSGFYQHQNVLRRDAVDRCPNAQPCAIAVLGAGFPLPFLVDKLGISVEGKLTIGEDEFRGGAFVGDVMIYWGLGLLVSRFVAAKK
jgi:hypothetical protein